MSWVLALVIATSPPAKELPPERLLARLDQLLSSLEFDQLLTVARPAAQRSDLTAAQRVEVYRYLAMALAVVVDPLEAEAPFRMLLRINPSYELPQGSAPKIVAVFRKVQTEEQAIARTIKELERERIIRTLTLSGGPGNTAAGGTPLRFSFQLKDPTGAVDAVRVPFKKQGERAWSTLALERTPAGGWWGSLAGEFTASATGFLLEYQVETVDREGVLLRWGAPEQPLQVRVLPGEVERARPVKQQTLLGAAVVSAVLSVIASGLTVAFATSNDHFTALRTKSGVIDGAEFARARGEVETLGTTAIVAGATAGAAIVTTALLFPLTDLNPPQP